MRLAVLLPLFTLSLFVACTAAASAAGTFTMLTAEEVRAEVNAALPEPPRPRAPAGPPAPRIQVVQPIVSQQPLRNPLRIDLQFAANADAEIEPASFRAYYGLLRLDLTERIVKSVRVTKSGLRVDNADIPPGNHRLFLRIADSKQRTSEIELRFTVE